MKLFSWIQTGDTPNKTRTFKVGAISKAQKAQNIFSEKKLEFFFRKMSHSAKKCKRGPFWIYQHTFCCKISKNSKVGPFGDIEKFSRSRTVPKNIQRGTL